MGEGGRGGGGEAVRMEKSGDSYGFSDELRVRKSGFGSPPNNSSMPHMLGSVVGHTVWGIQRTRP